MKLKSLSILTGVLFMASLGVYFQENYKSSNLVSGSYFIKGLDVEKIHKIVLKFEKDKELIFVRDQNTFAIESHKSYPASAKKVNDLIYKIASLQVKEKVTSGASEDELKSFELFGEKRKYLIEIYDGSGQKKQAFVVGKKNKGGGHYLTKEGSKEIYLSDSSIWLDSSYKDFIDRVVVNMKKDQIDKILVQGPEPLEIAKSGAEFALVVPLGKEAKKEKIDKYLSELKNARFNEVFKHSESEVQSVSFKHELEIQLANKLKYNLKLGEKSGKYFVKASALASDVPNKVVLNQNSGADELKGVGDMIQARQMADQFNLQRGAWVYQLDEDNYKKLLKQAKEFL